MEGAVGSEYGSRDFAFFCDSERRRPRGLEGRSCSRKIADFMAVGCGVFWKVVGVDQIPHLVVCMCGYGRLDDLGCGSLDVGIGIFGYLGEDSGKREGSGCDFFLCLLGAFVFERGSEEKCKGE